MRSKIAISIFIAVIAVFASTRVIGQQVRLRSQITPNCGVTSDSKFADIHADGNIAVLGTYDCRGVFIFDVSNPDNPTLSSWYNPSPNRQFLEAIVIGNRGYFGSGSGNGGGVHIVDLTNPASPQLLGTVTSANNAHNSIHEMMVFQQNGATYLIENFNGFSSKIIKVINVTNPALPVFVRDINPTEISWVHAFHIRGNKLYTSGWGTGSVRGRTEIYDISNIGTQAPTLLGYVEDPNGSASNGNNMHSSWTSEDGNFLYSAREIAGSGANGPSPGDVRVYNVSNPATPLLVNRVSMNDLGLNAVTPHNPVVMGNKLYVSWYQAGLQVFDISTPSTLTRIGQYDTYEPAFIQAPENQLSLTDEPWDMVCGVSNLQNAVPTNYNGLWAVFPFLGEDRVLIGDLKSGLIIVDVSGGPKNVVSDFDGDKKTDHAIFNPTSGDWLIENSSTGSNETPHWGTAGDRFVPGDYDGDGKSDVAIWRPSGGVWWILKSSGGFDTIQFGLPGDEPVAADYDADGKTDLALWRPSNGVWYIAQSTLGLKFVKWGISGDKPIAGDWDADGKPDLGIWRPSNGVWYVLPSSTTIPIYVQWGINGDRPLLGDFNSDSRSDFAVYRPSEGMWYILSGSQDSYIFSRFGLAEDIPIPADYDGDGTADIAVFRPSTNDWYRINSSDSTVVGRNFGQGGDLPSPSSVNPQ
ncbi:MAG TPA: FG-GAP-like repeat-containing protein [Pyrinomonadaceae bacterium]|nr:FG-GAP-like repeat-containing protein [Pyrinomonadaceae bacterium]